MKLIIATNNRHKTQEIRRILGKSFSPILSLSDAGIVHETVEDADTFLENAQKKAREIAAISGCAALADDSGLCVRALAGAPGVHSARYAGEHGNDRANNEKLLRALSGCTDRRAWYVCAVVIACADDTQFHAQGRLYGTIAHAPAGDGGFGYDPLFVPDGDTRTLAQYTAEEKDKISHRFKALRALLAQL